MFRNFLTRQAFALALILCATGCGRGRETDTTDITGVMPPLSFVMTRANDGARVSAANYRGKAVILYFGYTHCPDECPTTLANLAAALQRLHGRAKDVRVLFVTVDPARDTLPILNSYVRAFSPEIDGLRGDDNAIAALARRYRAIYSVTVAGPGHAYSVIHSDSVYFFDDKGDARLVTMSTDDTARLAAEIEAVLGRITTHAAGRRDAS